MVSRLRTGNGANAGRGQRGAKARPPACTPAAHSDRESDASHRDDAEQNRILDQGGAVLVLRYALTQLHNFLHDPLLKGDNLQISSARPLVYAASLDII